MPQAICRHSHCAGLWENCDMKAEQTLAELLAKADELRRQTEKLIEQSRKLQEEIRKTKESFTAKVTTTKPLHGSSKKPPNG
jgi:hypothetical protein